MAGYVCHTHFDKVRTRTRVPCTHLDPERNGQGWMCTSCAAANRVVLDAQDAEQRNCPDCKAVRAREAERAQATETIDPEQPYGEHIRLTCVHHSSLVWTTKNISFIGARSIFFTGDDPRSECKCPMGDLRLVGKVWND